MKRKLAIQISFAAPSILFFSFQSAFAQRSNFSNNVLSYVRYAEALESTRLGARGDLSGSDKKIVDRYYQEVREFYLQSQFQQNLNNARTVLNDKVAAIEKVREFVRNKDNQFSDAFGVCALDKSKLESVNPSAIQEGVEALNAVDAYFQNPTGQSLSQLKSQVGSDLEVFSTLEAMNSTNVKNELEVCCRQTNAAADSKNPPGPKSDCNKVNEIPLDKNLNTTLVFLPAQRPPSPLEDMSQKPAAIAGLINHPDVKAALSAARVDGDFPGSAGREQDIFSSIEEGCKKGQKEAQEESKPLDLRPWTPFFKAVKCHLLPTIATLYADTTTQKITLGVGAAQVQGEDWDVNCSPEEIALYDRMRPTDPNVVAQQWGIPQMANPAYIASLRMMPPLTGPFPITPVPGGGYVTPYGTIAIPENLPDVGGVPTTGESAGRRKNFSGDRRGAGGSGGNRGLGGASAKSTRAPLNESLRSLAGRARSGRGVANGQGLTVGTRALGSRIARGQGVAESINTLRSGAGQTRALAQNISTNVRSLGPSNMRTARKNLANQAQSKVRALGGARASRTTSEGVLESLRQSGRAGPTPGGPATPVVGSIGDVKKQNEQARKRMEKQVRMYIDDMELIAKRAEEVRKKILDLVASRDQDIINVTSSLPDKNPRKQSRAVQDLRMRLNEIDKQVSVLTSEFNTYKASMFERGELVRNLAAFGTSAPNYPGYGGQNDPNKLQNGFPKPSGGTGNSGGGRGQSAANFILKFVDKLWSLGGVSNLNLFTNAWASPTLVITSGLGQYASELEWGNAFDRYLGDLDKWVEIKRKEEKAAHQEIYNFMNRREKEVTLLTARDDDVETLVTMEIYSEALVSESRALIGAATDGKLPLAAEQISSLRTIEMDAQKSLDALERVNIDYAKSYPLQADDNAEAWMPILTGALLY